MPTERGTQVARLARFLVVGGGSLGVQLLIFRLVRPHAASTVTYCASWIISTAVHYLLNRFWALPSVRHDAARQLAEYLGTALLALAISTGTFELAARGFGMNELWATALSVPPSTIVVFLLLNYRVFRRSV